ncbi:MAG: hypothetical protein WAV78_18585, partial [Xanthobacteraceae bacterium]
PMCFDIEEQDRSLNTTIGTCLLRGVEVSPINSYQFGNHVTFERDARLRAPDDCDQLFRLIAIRRSD